MRASGAAIRRLVDEWVTAIGLRPEEYGTHSLRRTKASMIYKATGNIHAVQILHGHSKIENTARYLGVDVEDALLRGGMQSLPRSREDAQTTGRGIDDGVVYDRLARAVRLKDGAHAETQGTVKARIATDQFHLQLTKARLESLDDRFQLRAEGFLLRRCRQILVLKTRKPVG